MIAATPNAKTHVATSLISVAIGFGIAPNVPVDRVPKDSEMTDDDPNEAYEVVPMKQEPHGPPADWWTVTKTEFRTGTFRPAERPRPNDTPQIQPIVPQLAARGSFTKKADEIRY